MANVGHRMIPEAVLFATFSSEKPDWMSDLSVFCDCVDQRKHNKTCSPAPVAGET